MRKRRRRAPDKTSAGSPICANARASEARCHRVEGGGERERERWWAKKSGRRRKRWKLGRRVNKCQELFYGGKGIIMAGGRKSAANAKSLRKQIK